MGAQTPKGLSWRERLGVGWLPKSQAGERSCMYNVMQGCDTKTCKHAKCPLVRKANPNPPSTPARLEHLTTWVEITTWFAVTVN